MKVEVSGTQKGRESGSDGVLAGGRSKERSSEQTRQIGCT